MELKPRPTEYKGVRYRSKSEAMFARYLELRIEAEFALSRINVGSRCGSGGFVYEPSFLAIDNWTPDFFSWSVYCSKSSEPVLYATAIEYKPSAPTQTYLDEFGQRCFEVSQIAPYYCSFELFYGGFFNDGGLYVWTPDQGVFRDEAASNWAADFHEEVMRTRFDLELSQ